MARQRMRWRLNCDAATENENGGRHKGEKLLVKTRAWRPPLTQGKRKRRKKRGKQNINGVYLLLSCIERILKVC